MLRRGRGTRLSASAGRDGLDGILVDSCGWSLLNTQPSVHVHQGEVDKPRREGNVGSVKMRLTLVAFETSCIALLGPPAAAELAKTLPPAAATPTLVTPFPIPSPRTAPSPKAPVDTLDTSRGPAATVFSSPTRVEGTRDARRVAGCTEETCC